MNDRSTGYEPVGISWLPHPAGWCASRGADAATQVRDKKATVGTLINRERCCPGMLGSMVSSLSQRMVRLGTTTLMLSGAGLAGYSYYLDQQAEARGMTAQLAWVKDHATWFIALGVVGLVVGFLLNMMMMRRMTKQMMGGMGGPGGPGSMPDMSRLMAMQGMGGGVGLGAAQPTMAAAPVTETVKVRCRSCSGLAAESAAYCPTCGKALL